MNRFNFTLIAAAIALAFGSAAASANMSKEDYSAGKSRIANEFKTAKSGCDSFSANAKDVCMAEAKGKENIAIAELDAGYKPAKDSAYKVSLARATAEYSVAMEKCDDKAGNDKDVCIKQAKAAQVTAKADAKAQMKTTDANKVASDKTTAARATASEVRADANKDAATDKRNADYAVAREKCDTFAADAKTNCVKEAKVRFGQS